MAGIGNVKIEQAEMVFGVLVDDGGHFVAALRWAKGTPMKKIKVKGLHLLTDKAAVDGVAENGKWDFEGKKWDFPTEKHYVVDGRGQFVSGKAMWPDKLPPLKPGQEIVKKAPPKLRGRKPLWNGTDWEFPRRVGLIDANGVIINIVLENPREDQPDVAVPEGHERIDDRNWPVDGDGDPVGIGCKRDGSGNWTNPNKPEVA